MRYFHTVKGYFVATHEHHGEILHGHNFFCEVELPLDKNSAENRQTFQGVLENLDYTHLNKNPFLKDKTPSTENIALCIMEHLQEKNIFPDRVDIYETHLFRGGVAKC